MFEIFSLTTSAWLAIYIRSIPSSIKIMILVVEYQQYYFLLGAYQLAEPSMAKHFARGKPAVTYPV